MKIIRRVLFSLILFTLLVLLTAVYLYQTYATTEYAEKYLNTLLAEHTDSTYTLSLHHVDFNVPGRSIRIDSMSIETLKNNSEVIVNGTITRVDITKISLMDLITKKDIALQSFEIFQPQLNITLNEIDDKLMPSDSNKTVPLRGITTKEFRITNASGLYTFSDGEEYDLNNFSLFLEELSYTFPKDTISADHTFQNLLLSDLEVLYDENPKKLSLSELWYEPDHKNVTLTNFSITPIENYPELFGRVQYRTDHIASSFTSAEIENINVPELLDNGNLFADHVEITGIDFKFVRDYRLPSPPDKQPSQMPAEFLHSLGIMLNIPEIHIRSSDFHYTEIKEEGTRPGGVFFSQSDITILNLAYNIHSDEEPKFTEFDVFTKVENEIDVHANVRLKLNGTDNYMEAQGYLFDADPTIFSDASEALAGVKITSGHVDSLRFDLLMIDQKASGWLMMRYSDADIEIVDKDDGESGFRERLATFSTSTFVLRNDNQEPNPKRERGTIDYQNEEGDSFLRFFWRSLRDGIFDTAMRVR